VISTFLVEHAPLVRVGFWVAAVAAVAVGWLLHRMRARTALLVLAAIGLVGPLVLTLLPDGARPDGVTCTVQFSLPFLGLETLANLAMLLPLSLFLGLATGRPFRVLGGVSALAVGIELVQAVAPVLGRACDTNDWFMNTVGALIGALGAFVIVLVNERRRLAASVPGPRKAG
jgi:hypothetical protein